MLKSLGESARAGAAQATDKSKSDTPKIRRRRPCAEAAEAVPVIGSWTSLMHFGYSWLSEIIKFIL
jgi:hypothetical protein